MPRNHDIFITDLPARVVGGFKPARGVGRGWAAVDYRSDDFSGVGLATGYDSKAPELVLNLGLRGEQVLYLGMAPYSHIRVWLDGEKGFRELGMQHGGAKFQEARLHLADLTGKRLHIAPVPVSPGRTGDASLLLAYIRACPSDHAPKRSSRNMVATNDGFSWIALDGIASVRDVSKHFTPFRDSDFFRMLWGPLGADVTGNHRSKVGTLAPSDVTHAYRRCDREFARAVGRIVKGGGDILRAAVAGCRDAGMEFQFYIRPEAFFCPFPYDHTFASQFLLKNPQWRCRDEWGRQVMRMSYAYPQVQQHMFDYFDELFRYQPDGLCLAFNRSLPMMICEEPVLAAFERQHGRRPRLPEEVDSPELIAIRQQLLSAFLERLAERMGKRKLSLSCIADFDDKRPSLMGLNLPDLNARGVFQSIHVAGYCPASDYWKGQRSGGRAKIYSSVHYIHVAGMPAVDAYNHQWQAQALSGIHEAGFAGGFFWDTENQYSNPYNWHVYRHGGSPRFLRRMLAKDAKLGPTFRPIVEVRGIAHDRYDPMSSY